MNRGVGVYVASPFSASSSQPRRVATWTPKTWTLASGEMLFPEKFHVFVFINIIYFIISVVNTLFEFKKIQT